MSEVRLVRPVRDFLHTEAAGGVLLVAAAVIGLIWANSPWVESYAQLFHTEISISVGSHAFDWTLQHWINDGLMTLFFLLVGLEIKRELTTGHLADRRAAALPGLAAIGGMAVPALLYLAIAGQDTPRGWGIPMATDIALAMGVVALLGSRVVPGLRLFLLALAIVDDIGAILVIAVFYSGGIEFAYLGLAVATIAAIVVARNRGVRWHWLYVTLGIVGWYAFYKAGIHPTLIGVVLGLLAPAVPFRPAELVDVEELADVSSVEAAQRTVAIARESISVVEWLEYRLHGWVSFLIVPLFAMANIGVTISRDTLHDAVTSPLGLGIIVGLVVGKVVGVVGVTLIAVRLGVGALPEGATRRALVGVGFIAGIGFTVALFVAELAIEDPSDVPTATLAVLIGSVLAGVVGVLVLLTGHKPADSAAAPG